MTVFSAGFLTYLALTVAIGAQTLFLLRQVVRGDRAWTAIGVCFLSDIVLLLAGAAGVGAAAERAPWLVPALTVAGVAYLVWFGVSALRSARRGDRTLADAAAGVEDDAWAPTAEEVAAMTGSLPVVAAGPDAGADAATAPAGTGGGVALRTRPVSTTAPASAAPRPAHTPLPRLVLLCLSVSLLNPHAILDAVVMMGTFAQGYGADKWLYVAGAVASSALWFLVLGWGGAKLAPLMNTPRTWRIVDGAVGVVVLGIAGKVALTLF